MKRTYDLIGCMKKGVNYPGRLLHHLLMIRLHIWKHKTRIVISAKVQDFICRLVCSCWASVLETTMMDIIFWDFLILCQIFLSPQVKRRVITSNKHGIYELPHELPQDLRLMIFGNSEISGKSQNIIEF